MKKVKVRIAVAVDPKGDWNCCGWGGIDNVKKDEELMDLAVDSIADGEARYWLEAELDLPSSALPIAANVTNDA